MATVRSQINEFEIEEFFRSLTTMLTSSFNDNVSFDSAEYISRRLDLYERNLSLLFARLSESHHLEVQLLSDMRSLLEIVGRQRERCESLSFRSFFEENETAGNGQATIRVSRTGVRRPTVDVSPDVLETLHDQIGFSWAEIARNLGISESTIRRRRRSLGVGSTNSRSVHSTISNDDLDQMVRSILRVTPRIGYRLVQGALRRRGLHIQRRRVLESLQRVDPVTITIRSSRSIIRRRYSVPCPNALWYVSTIRSIVFSITFASTI